MLLFVNGMGGTTADRALHRLSQGWHEIATKHGLTVVRNLVGTYITSLGDGRLLDHLAQARRRNGPLWDAPVMTPGLRWGV